VVASRSSARALPVKSAWKGTSDCRYLWSFGGTCWHVPRYSARTRLSLEHRSRIMCTYVRACARTLLGTWQSSSEAAKIRNWEKLKLRKDGKNSIWVLKSCSPSCSRIVIGMQLQTDFGLQGCLMVITTRVGPSRDRARAEACCCSLHARQWWGQWQWKGGLGMRLHKGGVDWAPGTCSHWHLLRCQSQEALVNTDKNCLCLVYTWYILVLDI
jgi:hypothetical protein